MTYRIFIIEDQPAIRAIYKLIIDREPAMQFCGEAASANQAVAQLPHTNADIILLDLSLPGMNGLEFLEVLRQSYPQCPVIVVSGHDEAIYAKRAMELGASGFIHKRNVVNVLRSAVHCVASGASYCTQHFIELAAKRNLRSRRN